MTPLIREMVQFVDDPETAHWFDLGNVDKHVPAARLEWDVAKRMPYPRTCCVFKTIESEGVETKYVVWLLEGDNSITLAYIGLAQGKKPVFSRSISILEIDGELVYRVGDNRPTDEAAVKNVARVLIVVAQNLNKERVAYRPEKSGTPAQQAKRRRHGKAPLFDWHTVSIDPVKPEASQSLGGHHASPRLHDRRGHWRTYPSGKRGWVKSCKVGDASKGVVFKDYRIKEMLP